MTQAPANAARSLLHHPATAWVILLLSFALTGVAWHLSDKYVRQRAQDRFTFQTEDIKARIVRRMLDYEAALRGGAGLFAASTDVSRDEWRAYAESLQLGVLFPGIQGFGYSQIVMPSQRTAHEAQIRAEGYPDYRIKPAGERKRYTAIIYLEPFNTRNQRAFGYDMFSEATRRAAMELARDSGQPALSGRVTLVQETADPQYGVLTYLPVYRNGQPHNTVEQRRAALQGFVYAPFRMRDLMQGILGADQKEVEFGLFDGVQPSPQNLLYQSHAQSQHGENIQVETDFSNLSQIKVAGRTWSLFIHSNPGFLSNAEESQPLLVAAGGLLVDLLLFFIIGSIARQRHRAEALANKMTIELRRSNADLEQFAYAASHDMRQPLRMVSSYLQLLEMDLQAVLTDETRQNLAFAVDGAKRMDQMLTALLAYSRVGRVAEPKTRLDSRAPLDEALKFLQPAISEAHADIHLEGNWPQILATRDDIVRLWQNLIGNALKYRLEGRQQVIVVSATAGPFEHRFAVRDNGIGLLPGQETRLFKIFERLQPRDKYPGDGIGLALCRKIVEYHGGRIWVESAGENRGCTFTFTLPAAPFVLPLRTLRTQNHDG